MATPVTPLPILMLIQHNLLRLVRIRAPLTQGDIAAILQIADFANVSRWEQGLRSPNIDALLSYHLLFDVPVEMLFERHKTEMIPLLIPRIRERLAYLQRSDKESKTEGRIRFLDLALNRLNSLTV